MIREKILRMAMAAVMAVSALVASAQNGGSSAYNFLDITGSSRIFGLGGVNVSVIDPDDVMTTDQNPALLGPEMSKDVGFSYMRYVGSSNFANLKFTHAAGENGAWGVGVHYFGYGSITSALPDGTITGTFSPKDMAFTAQYAHNIGARWRGGIAMKFLYSAYDSYTAMAVATDLGVNYYNEERDASFSLVLANLGGQVKKFNEKSEKLPFDIRLGGSFALGDGPLTLNITAWNLTHWHLPYWDMGDGSKEPELKDKFASNLFRHLIFGLEWRPNERFHLDLGYNYKQSTDLATYSRSFFSGFSIGAGLKVRAFGFGVAFAQPHKSATTLMLNITTNLYDL